MALLARAAAVLRDRGQATEPTSPPPLDLPAAVAERLTASGTLTEHAAKTLLAACGLRIAPSQLVSRREDLAAAASLGFPLAAKIQSAAIPHKTEAGGVRLGIADAAALETAFDDILSAAARHAPDAAIDGVLVEPMAPPGVEIIVGVVRDPTFGPVVTVGAGGVTTELFHDVAYALAPLDEAAAEALIRTLRSAPLLDGFRGARPADIAALARLVSLISLLADAGRDRISELELNPVIVHAQGRGCTVADALLGSVASRAHRRIGRCRHSPSPPHPRPPTPRKPCGTRCATSSPMR